MSEQKAAGKNIESRCTKCKLNLDHTIIAMEGDVVAKVKCNTCGSRHKYRDPAAPVKARKESTAKPTAENIWESALAGARGKERIYDMTAQYRVGEVVLHHVFGKGVVQKLYAHKCGMLFRDKERLMASGN